LYDGFDFFIEHAKKKKIDKRRYYDVLPKFIMRRAQEKYRSKADKEENEKKYGGSIERKYFQMFPDKRNFNHIGKR
jgi:hypothetical protein